ncbi:MAG: helix-turn-helix transcriptional regulator [Lachnospiraceae bacterium]|nr:helix-turn-helix transcriptional regulator [Lachnospiraceae bacterium]
MISTNISTLRKRFNMTQEEVAEKINVSRQALAKWERGV